MLMITHSDQTQRMRDSTHFSINKTLILRSVWHDGKHMGMDVHSLSRGSANVCASWRLVDRHCGRVSQSQGADHYQVKSYLHTFKTQSNNNVADWRVDVFVCPAGWGTHPTLPLITWASGVPSVEDRNQGRTERKQTCSSTTQMKMVLIWNYGWESKTKPRAKYLKCIINISSILTW